MLKRHYPGYEELLNTIPDHRNRCTYSVAEIIMAGLSIFIFKRGSRNNADKGARGNYESNYFALFGMKLPIMDTVDDFLRKLPPEELDRIKRVLIGKLLEKKVLNKWKFEGRYLVACDATGVFSFSKKPFEGCPYKTSKNGKKSWQANVLEAKIVCPNGLSISIASEWLCNSEDLSKKQDCELKAFVRLAAKVKKWYPRLPAIILADGLYPNITFFDICKKNQWEYILTHKDGTLKSLWQEINFLYLIQEKENKKERLVKKINDEWLYESSMFINGLEYQTHQINWVEYQSCFRGKEVHERFVYLTSLNITHGNVWEVIEKGRLRWRIENEGFNTQKNGAYEMQHKYAEKNFQAMRNYYNLLQIAHMINQLTEKLTKVKQAIVMAQATLKSIWEDVLATLQKETLCPDQIRIEFENCKQLRY